jgi:hypothetical protein
MMRTSESGHQRLTLLLGGEPLFFSHARLVAQS